jgi:aspartyl-tRNA(Asn)/glutamyl-tRNA(Gln) amidotransferase subunit C
MNKIKLDKAKKVASLAKIEFSDEELEKVSGQLNGVLNWLDKLQELDTDNIEPLINPTEGAVKLSADIAIDDNSRDEVLRNAPNSKYGYFVVPKVIE